MDRKLCLISPDLGQILVKQIAHELKNYNLYVSFANYFETEGIVDLGTYYYKRAEEEKHHSEWIEKYLTDADYKFIFPQIEKNEVTFETYIDPFILTVEREIETTQMLYNVVELTMKEKDYMTYEWMLRTLIAENREEENTSRMARSVMEQEADIFIKAKKVLNLLEK